MTKIICGPVVGLVTTNSANVLLEVDESVSVEMGLKEVATGQTATVTVKLTAKVPGMFLFTSLESDRTYDIIATGLTGKKVLGRVRTLPDEIGTIGLGVVSCDRPESSKTDSWEDFYKKATEDNIRVVLHIGDNVYIDGEGFGGHSTKEVVENDAIALDPKKVKQISAYLKARKVLKDVAKDDWPAKKEEILQIYRTRYREVFTGKHKAKVLANFCNLMILDDHEIRDDFGMLEQDSDPESREYFLGSLALQVYHEYQRQLWDPDVLHKADTLKSEYYSVQFGALKIVMTDTRMTRATYKHRRQPGDDSYYGREQGDEISKSLVPDGNTRLCVMIYSMPLFFLKRKLIQISQLAGNKYDDINELINNHHSSEIEPIIEAINQYKTQTGGDVIMFAGDLHIGGFTDILKRKKGKDEIICHQITTSAINNKNNAVASYTALRALMNFVDIYGDYSYKHYDWTKEHNFALLDVNFKDADQLTYRVKLVDRLKTEVRHSSDPDWDKGIKTVTSSCCEIL